MRSRQPHRHASACTSVPPASAHRASLTLGGLHRVTEPGIKYPRSKYPKGIPGVTTSEFPPEVLCPFTRHSTLLDAKPPSIPRHAP